MAAAEPNSAAHSPSKARRLRAAALKRRLWQASHGPNLPHVDANHGQSINDAHDFYEQAAWANYHQVMCAVGTELLGCIRFACELQQSTYQAGCGIVDPSRTDNSEQQKHESDVGPSDEATNDINLAVMGQSVPRRDDGTAAGNSSLDDEPQHSEPMAAAKDSGLDSLEVRSRIQQLIVGIRESQPQARWQPLMENIIKSSVVQKAAAAEGQSEMKYIHCLMQELQQQEPMTLSEDSLESDVPPPSVPDTTAAGQHVQRRAVSQKAAKVLHAGGTKRSSRSTSHRHRRGGSLQAVKNGNRTNWQKK